MVIKIIYVKPISFKYQIESRNDIYWEVKHQLEVFTELPGQTGGTIDIYQGAEKK